MVTSMATHNEPVEAVVRVMRILSDPTRLRLLGLLRDGELNVTTLCRRLQLPQPTVSHHLGLLRSAGLVGNRRAGKQVFYCLSQPAVEAGRDNGGLTIALESIQLCIPSLKEEAAALTV
jgi:DNA-binding transcriptional ArsR family regulator